MAQFLKALKAARHRSMLNACGTPRAFFGNRSHGAKRGFGEF
jgi:hypothetical protein